jgi:hypothetical protein
LVFITLGVSYIIVGICAIIFNKYPSRKEALKKLERKYGKIDRKKLCKLDGIVYLVGGGLLCTTGIFINAQNVISLFSIILSLLLIMIVSYYPIRKKYLGSKK